MKRRLYKSGASWCLWRWTAGNANNDNVDRLHVLKTPWFALAVHFIHGPDPQPFEHDHPVTFLSIILRGSYGEQRSGVPFLRRHFNYIRATDHHRIIVADPKTVTLCFMGPKVREWGFHTDDGWVYWKDYLAKC